MPRHPESGSDEAPAWACGRSWSGTAVRTAFRKDQVRRPRPLPAVCNHAGRSAQKPRSEEHTSELQSLMRNSYAVFCLKKKKNKCIQQMQKRQNIDIKPKINNNNQIQRMYRI